MIRLWGVMALVAMLSACTEQVARRPSPEVTFKAGRLLYKGERFKGILEERFDAAETVRKTHYRDGLPDGLEEEFTKSGQIVARREYRAGKKVGVHEGWFANGKRRFYYEYSNGEFDGEAWEWYNSGGLAMYVRFDKGRVLGKKMWREDGKIYMNWVFVEDRAVGVPGAKLCYQVRGQERPK